MHYFLDAVLAVLLGNFLQRTLYALCVHLLFDAVFLFVRFDVTSETRMKRTLRATSKPSQPTLSMCSLRRGNIGRGAASWKPREVHGSNDHLQRTSFSRFTIFIEGGARLDFFRFRFRYLFDKV